MLYSHDALGLGHTRRNLTVAAALTKLAPEASVLLVTGTDVVNRLGVPPNVEVLKLPGLRKVANEHYTARRLRISATDIFALRSALLTAVVESFRPTVMLVDKHPLGAGGELRPALDALHAMGGRAVLGLRDILDDRTTVLDEWARHDLHTRIAEHYDQVLVYGHRSVFDPIEEYDLPTSVAERTRFCGYVVHRSANNGWADDRLPAFAAESRLRPVVLAATGGGEDGFALLKTFVRAAAGAAWDGVVVTGPDMPEEERRTLAHLVCGTRVTLHTFVPDLDRWFGLVDALVCMGGYNTLAEAVSEGTPIVCIPRTFPRSEQLIRARAFDRLGLLRTVEPAQLDVGRLCIEVTAALALSRRELTHRAQALLKFDGASLAASHLLEVAEVGEAVASARG
jgi:predicted glycosyltransferase